ncbi:hypothetical protein FVE85_2784 [Porphyridium purpureum]|uniref:Uncharacterized protein n=1 Tax=Porphyridium purpureum TaxID=35688 RepID=A0A5J4YUV9_PORPP|nr:hypothetical protein FVE85_2784 [Porphyridium purpureum]|eukprot:POR7695..scf227_4
MGDAHAAELKPYSSADSQQDVAPLEVTHVPEEQLVDEVDALNTQGPAVAAEQGPLADSVVSNPSETAPHRDEVPDAVEELAREKSLKTTGCLFVRTTSKTPEGTIVKIKKSKTGSYLLEVRPAASRGSFELGVTDVTEFKKLDKMFVSMDLATLDLFCIRDAEISKGMEERSKSSSGAGEKKMTRSKSGKRDPDIVYEYFYPEALAYRRAVDASSSGIRIPPIGLQVMLTGGFKNGSSSFIVEWVEADQEIRRLKNKKMFDFLQLVPKTPDYPPSIRIRKERGEDVSEAAQGAKQPVARPTRPAQPPQGRQPGATSSKNSSSAAPAPAAAVQQKS